MSGTSMAAIVLGLLGTYIAIAVIWWLVQVIGKWKMFSKMGEAGWKSIIPIYADYIMYKDTWKPKFFWISLLLMVVSNATGSMSVKPDGTSNMVLVLISLVLVIAYAVIYFKSMSLIAKAFGKGIGCALALIFVAPIAQIYLGFSGAQYIGNQSES